MIPRLLMSDQTSAKDHLKAEESTVARVLDQGGLILAGTDSPLDLPAVSLHLNLRAQVKYGRAPWQALETATSLSAKAYGLERDLGTLEPGHLADLILVSGDPLKDITDAAGVQCVIKTVCCNPKPRSRLRLRQPVPPPPPLAF